MAKVIGVGGIFFHSPDPSALMAWYADKLGLEINDYGGADFLHAGAARAFPQGARTVFSPFRADTDYFAPSDRPFMINLIVDDMDAMLARLTEALEKGPYLLGEHYTAADLLCSSPFQWFSDLLPDNPRIRDWVARCMDRPAVAAMKARDAALIG